MRQPHTSMGQPHMYRAVTLIYGAAPQQRCAPRCAPHRGGGGSTRRLWGSAAPNLWGETQRSAPPPHTSMGPSQSPAPFRPRPHRAPKPGCVPKGAWLQKGAWPSSGSSALPPQMCGAVPGLLYGGTCGAVMGQDPHLRGTYGAERGTYGAQHPKWDTSGAE